jgi:CheY-like chemotaxis protein
MENKKLSVLLVDDDEINRLVACTFLKKWDIDVTVATDGQTALDLIPSKSFDLIMMDLQMPGMDGYECARQIRAMKDPWYRDIPILVFSASAMIDSRKKAKEFGMTDFMNKPFRQEELRAKLAQYLPMPSGDFRPLKIDFAKHTDGEVFFKIELLHLLGDNLTELRQTLDASMKAGDPGLFLNATHKVSSAIEIVNDAELSSALEAVKQSLKESDKTGLDEVIARFIHILSEISRSIDHHGKVMQQKLQQP